MGWPFHSCSIPGISHYLLAPFFACAPIASAIACPPLTDREVIHISSFELDIPKALIIGIQTDEDVKSRLLIGLAVPMDCLGLKLMAPYNTGKIRELFVITLHINGAEEGYRLVNARSRFKAQSGSFNGWSTYQGNAGYDLYVAPDTGHPLIMAFCDNNPQINGPDTPKICDAETDVAIGTDSQREPEVLTAHYSLLRKDLYDISEIDKRARLLVGGMIKGR